MTASLRCGHGVTARAAVVRRGPVWEDRRDAAVRCGDALVKWPVLASVPEPQVRALLSVARRRRFARNEVVFHEGDPGDTVHLIDKGRVALRVTTPLGDTVTLRILGTGALFGELAVLAPAPRNATVVALERTETLALHRDHFDDLRREHPDVDRILLDALITEVRRLSTQLLEALYVPVPRRISLRLIDLAAQYAEHDGPVDIPLTQDDLAGLCGTSRTTVNKVLRGLEADGLVTVTRGHVVIPDPDRLRPRRGTPA
jgi:CRP/FNR family transcriptional regulator, cyclic AMP receptor protein